MLTPMLATVSILLAVAVAKLYDLVVAMMKGGPGLSSEVPAKFIMGQFFRAFNVGLGAMLLLQRFCFVTVASNSRASFQLYSARKFPPLEAQCAALAETGYACVETFGPLHDDAAATRRLLESYGLAARSAHFSLDMTENHAERTVDIARELGVEIIVAPHLTPAAASHDRRGLEGVGHKPGANRRTLRRRGLSLRLA